MLTDDDLARPLQTLQQLVDDNRRIHEVEAVNLNPAANVMNPEAEALLATSLGTRPSLGNPGDKYEMGLEAVERIEILAAHLAKQVFHARHVELRLPSGATANLASFLALCRPGAPVIVPPASIAGHVTHHEPGAAGLLGLEIIEAPVDAQRYTVDVDGVAQLARAVEPAMITIGGSLNLRHHPVSQLREIADEVGAILLFDAAHLSGPIAGGRWPNPLTEGAHVMTMSTYKSLAGPPAGLVATDDASLIERISTVVFPGITANFDVANTAALARTLVDWEAVGPEYAAETIAAAEVLAEELEGHGIEVYRPDDGGPATESHAFAVRADRFGGGHEAAQHLRRANLLTSAIATPSGDAIRVGTNEAVRWGMTRQHMARLAELFAAAWTAPDDRLLELADDVTAFRAPFDQIGFTS